ncbi:hypothetical protein JXB01_02910 [Candidatus Micrarchaeota archaeon]|nr:hypothetical protein [Candidatus Micrarchaeota archaeon]
MKVCIECKKELKKEDLKKAVKVKDDRIIKTIRSIKKKLNIAANNELYICAECLQEHKRKRKDYEKNMVLIIALSVLIFLGLGFLPIIAAGQFRLSSFLAGLLVGAILIVLAGILKYTPAAEGT